MSAGRVECSRRLDAAPEVDQPVHVAGDGPDGEEGVLVVFEVVNTPLTLADLLVVSVDS